MRISVFAVVGLGAAIGAGQQGLAQGTGYQVGEQVELQANGDHWQSCVVAEAGSRETVMRLRCEPYEAPGYSRGGGIYVESYNSSAVRRAGQRQKPTNGATQAAGARPRSAPASGAAASGYHIGQAVEIEASKHWVPCRVSSIEPGGSQPLIRVDCPAYPALSRVAGTYIVHNVEEGMRPATGRTGPAPAPNAQAPQPPRAAAGGTGTLPLGEYTCVGQGGRMMYGLSFRLTGPNTYTDLDNARRGTYRITGTNISFSGGHLDGVNGRDIKGNGFRVAAQAECELWE